MKPTIHTSVVSTKLDWAGRIVSGIVVLFMLFDGAMKLLKIAPVMQAMGELGYPEDLARALGTLVIVCTVVYMIPRTSILGAVLLTGYLGGAIASNWRVGHPFSECIFPVIVGVLVWGGLFVRDDGLRAFVPLRS